MDVKEIIETGLGGVGKVKIIRALAEENKLATIYFLHKKTHLKREDIKRNVEELVEIGWVMRGKYGHTVYSINTDNAYVRRLVEYFRDIGYVGPE